MQEKENCLQLEARRSLQIDPNTSLDVDFLKEKSLKSKFTYQQLCVYACVHSLTSTTLVQNFIKAVCAADQTDIVPILKGLWAVYLYYGGNGKKSQFIEAIYRQLMLREKTKKTLLKNCLLPASIKPAAQDGQLAENEEQIISRLLTMKGSQQKIDFKGQAKIMMLLSQFDQNKKNGEMIWNKMIHCLGNHPINLSKLVDFMMNITIGSKKYLECLFLFKKLMHCIGKQAILKILVNNANRNYKQGGQIEFIGRIDEVMNEDQQNKFRNSNNYIVVLSLFVKFQVIDWKQIFYQLTPQSQVLYSLAKRRLKIQKQFIEKTFQEQSDTAENEKNLWGNLMGCSKLDLLQHLVVLNSYYQCTKIMKQFKIQPDLMHHSGLLLTFSMLIEWILDPLLQKYDVRFHFKINFSMKKQVIFSDGDIKQYSEMNSNLMDIMVEILSVTSCLVFARRSTFIKMCRVLKTAIPNFISSEDGNKELLQKIYILIKKWLIPALQSYRGDPSVAFALDDVLNCFSFKEQELILLGSLNCSQFKPFQLSIIDAQVRQEQNKLLNRLSKSSSLVFIRLKKLLINNSLSCMEQIVVRVANFKLGKNEIVEQILWKVPSLSKKILVLFLLTSLSESEKTLINTNSNPSQAYQNIILFTTHFLCLSPDSSILGLAMEYFMKKLQINDKKLVELTNFEYFHGQVCFLSALLKKALPIQNSIAMNLSNRELLSAGTYLKALSIGQEKELMQSSLLRKRLASALFNNQKIFKTNFFAMIFYLCRLLQQTVQSTDYNIPVTAKIYDQGHSLILLLIKLAHLQIQKKDMVLKMFSIDDFYKLLIEYGIPFEIVFALIRKGLLFQIEQWSSEQTWSSIKVKCLRALEKLNLYDSWDKKSKANEIMLQAIDRKRKLTLFNMDLFSLFWLCDIESLFFPKELYRQHFSKLVLNRSRKTSGFGLKMDQDFQFQLSQEKARYEIRNEILTRDKLSVFDKTVNVIFKMNSDSQKQTVGLFLRYCIISRAILSESDAFYSWLFLIEVVKVNNVSALNFIEIICALNCYLVDFLHFSTERQASCMISLLANCSSEFMLFEDTLFDFQKKFEKIFGFSRTITKKQFESILNTLACCHKKLIEKLTECDSQLYSVKNNLYFMKNVSYVPFVMEHTHTLMLYLNKIYAKYGIMSQDIADQIDIVKVEINKRHTRAKSFEKRTVLSTQRRSTSQKEISFDMADNSPVFSQVQSTLQTNQYRERANEMNFILEEAQNSEDQLRIDALQKEKSPQIKDTDEEVEGSYLDYRKKSPQIKLKKKKKSSAKNFCHIVFDSKIIRKEDYQSFNFIYFSLKKPKTIELLFRSSENNFLANKFHFCCDNIPHTFTLLRTEFNKVIGGYTPLAWKSDQQRFVTDQSKQSFLVSVDLKQKMNLISPSTAIYRSKNCGPSFGNKDIYISDKCNINRQSNSGFPRSYNYSRRPYGRNASTWRLMSGASDNSSFKVNEYQVFKVSWG